MKIIKACATIEQMTENPLSLIELAGRTCYMSHEKTGCTIPKHEDCPYDSYQDYTWYECRGCPMHSTHGFVRRLIKSGHHSVLEHASATVRFIVDRGVSHELVRHRLASFSQESTRYANYSKDKFGSEITVVDPGFWVLDSGEYAAWEDAMRAAETAYMGLLNMGARQEQARSVLPNSLKTEVVMTANFREWRHIFGLRCSNAAHPQMREVMIPLLKEFQSLVPVAFDDLGGKDAEG